MVAAPARLQIKYNERVALIGKTGSGKTYLARYLTKDVPRLLVLDPKARIAADEWDLDDADSDTRRDLLSNRPVRILVRAESPVGFIPWLRLAWSAQNVIVYIDELYGLVDEDMPPAERKAMLSVLRKLYTLGRELDIGVWSAMQRPSWIPLFALSESDYYMIFRLQLDEDRKRVAAFVGEEIREGTSREAWPDKFGFWLYYNQWDEAIYYPRFVPAQLHTGVAHAA